ncbi:phage holin family protein [Adhaeribacter soli]|uniref:phage holin family protein n=1 Tax=Adhaeribacter soli TaxID=2607655 RepID=UPI001CDA308F|nr:phage holin family protein [Adhaeribacter soli]
MIEFIVSLLVSAGVILLMAYLLPSVTVKSFGTALWVAILIGILNATVGWLLRFPMNLVTFFLLEFVVRLIVTAIMIKLADKLVRNFEVRGFWPAIVIAIALAAATTLVSSTFNDNDRTTSGEVERVY